MTLLSCVALIGAATILGIAVAISQTSKVIGRQVCFIVSGSGRQCIRDTGPANPVSSASGPVSIIRFVNPIKTPNGSTWYELQSATGMCLSASHSHVYWDPCVPGDPRQHFGNHGALLSLYGDRYYGSNTWVVWSGGQFGLNSYGEFGHIGGGHVDETLSEAPVYG